MNKYDKLVIFILLKVCRIISQHCSVEYVDTYIYCIENELKGSDNNDK